VKTSLFVLATLLIGSSIIRAETYTWSTVRVGGGGATTTIQAHPLVPNLYFMTTDVGTPYRWNNDTQRWDGMLYGATKGNRIAGARLAFDPRDKTGNILYITTGGEWSVDGTVLKSTDRGHTWTDCHVLLDVNPNKEQGAGQRIEVDPQNSNVVYVVTRGAKAPTPANGTFKTLDAGATWTKINDICGNFVQFDPSGGKQGDVTKNIFIGNGDGVYESTDGGANFTLMPNSPPKAIKASLHSSGTMYVTSSTGVHKWDGSAWSTISPPTKGGYSAVAVNPQNKDEVVVSSSSWSPYVFNHYRSKDGGATWKLMEKKHDKSEDPWFATSIGQATGTFCWNPFNQSTVWFGDFFFAYETTDVWASPVLWKSRSAGHEETVTEGTLLAPPSGDNVLFSCVADVGGWDHKSLTDSPAVGMVKFFPFIFTKTISGWGNMTGVAVEETNPNFIARVGRVSWNGDGYCGYSTDGGTTYTLWKSPAGAAGGRIAVSATSETMVWVPQTGPAYRSTDRGTTWTLIASIPKGTFIGDNVFASGPRHPLAADKVTGDKFYVYCYGKLYVSTDGGATFAPGGELPFSYATNNLTVETTPGRDGDLWVGMIKDGLYHSIDSGKTFTKITKVQSADFLAVGKASNATPSNPAVYVYGKVNSSPEMSLYRSDDDGATWTDLGAPQIGVPPFAMAADQQTYGRVYLGTKGNGIFYGDPSTAAPPASPASATVATPPAPTDSTAR